VAIFFLSPCFRSCIIIVSTRFGGRSEYSGDGVDGLQASARNAAGGLTNRASARKGATVRPHQVDFHVFGIAFFKLFPWVLVLPHSQAIYLNPVIVQDLPTQAPTDTSAQPKEVATASSTWPQASQTLRSRTSQRRCSTSPSHVFHSSKDNSRRRSPSPMGHHRHLCMLPASFSSVRSPKNRPGSTPGGRQLNLEEDCNRHLQRHREGDLSRRHRCGHF